MPSDTGPLSAYTYEEVTVAGTAIGFTSTNLRNFGTAKVSCRKVRITTETDSVRYTVDGTTPTSSVGHLVPLGSNLTIEGLDNITNFRAIKVTNNASLKCTFYA